MEREEVDKVFKKMRARMFNMVEQMGLDETQLTAYKKTIREITSEAWNNISEDMFGELDRRS